MRNWIISVKYFYKDCTVFNLVFTALGVDLLIKYGPEVYSYIFWLKVVGYGFTHLVYYWSRKKYLYFFNNLNQSWIKLIISSVTIDTFLTLLIVTIVTTLIS